MRALFVFILIFIMSYSAFAQSTLPRVTVWLYRPDTDNSGLPLTLHMDGRKLTSLGKDQFFGIQVLPGLHAFSWTTAPAAQQVVIPIGPDPQAYLEVTFGSSQPFLVVNTLSAEKAIVEMSGLRPVDRNSVFDSGVIIPAQAIQATPKAPATESPTGPQPQRVSVLVQQNAPAPLPASIPPAPQGIAANRSQATKLATVRKLYIGDLGKEEGADLVREKVRVRLFKAERFSVVERLESADAVLTGAAGVIRRYDSDVNGGSTSFQGSGVLRLVDAKTDETLWVFEYKRGFFVLGSVSSRVADQIVDKLLKDAEPRTDKKKR